MSMNLPHSTYASLDRFGLVGLLGATGAVPSSFEVPAQSSFHGSEISSQKLSANPQQVHRSETLFFSRAFESGQRVMFLASQVLEREENPDALTHARRLSDHHEKMTAELAQLSCSHGCDVEHLVQQTVIPTVLIQSDLLPAIAREQEDLVALFEDGARGLGDSDMRAFAGRQLPILLNDLSTLESLKKLTA